ncbi:MAG: hypothetical protein FWC45_06160 [Treponema sp.]|nr:hypothetical protein [Treponema sp.]
MTRGILIAGNESSLLAAAAAEAAKRVESFGCAVISNRFPLPEGGGGQARAETAGGAVPLSWNPASPISARTLIVAAENRLQRIDNAIVVCSPPAVIKPAAAALAPEEIEILVNDHIRGWFFLIRELVLYFRRISGGSLSLVVSDIVPGSDREAAGISTRGGSAWSINTRGKNTVSKSGPADLLGPSAAASFRAFAQGVLATSEDEPFQVTGFTTAEAGAEADFAAWFFKILDEGAAKNSGRWHRYAKSGLFKL